MGEMILTATDEFKLSAYRATPEGRPRAGLVVLQEIFGVTAHMRRVADGFAALGYLTLAPALFDRAERGVELAATPADMARGVALRSAIALDDTLADVAAAIAALAPVGKVAVVGYCWGGTLAYSAACRLPGVAGAVGYYGGGIAAMAREKPNVPVMLHFGESDTSIPGSAVAAIRTARPEIEVFTYPAGHAFNRDGSASFEAASAALALTRTRAFLERVLG